MAFTIWYRNHCVDLVDHATAQKWVAAWQRWLVGDVCPEWPQAAAILHYIGDSQTEKPPVTAQDGVMDIVAKSSTDGALGSHWMNGVQPQGEIGVQTCIDDGVPPSSCGAHETGEMALDPPASLCFQVGNLILAAELNDRVEGSDQTYMVDGVPVENFSMQAAFNGGPGPWDFRKKCSSNVVLPNGYQLQLDLGTSEWSQITGELARASKRFASEQSRRGQRIVKAGGDLSKLRVVPA